MGYIEHPCNNPQAEVQSVLRANDIGQQTLNLTLPEYNPKAVSEIREYVSLCTKTSKQIVMHELITKKFHNRPYGWPEWETVLILARLIVASEIQLIMNGAIVESKRVYERISKTSNWRKITIKLRKMVDSALLEQTRQLSRDLFGVMGPDNEDGLFNFFREKLSEWHDRLCQYRTLAETGNYPGREEINTGIGHISILLNDKESYIFINRLKELKDDLVEFAEDFHDIDNFYKSQKPVWEKLQKAYNKFEWNRFELEKDADAGSALRRMKEILETKAPYGIIQEAEVLINKVESVNTSLVSAHRSAALKKIEFLIDELDKELTTAQADEAFRNTTLRPLLDIKNSVQQMESIAHLQQASDRAQSVLDQQIAAIAEYLKSKAEPTDDEKPKPQIKQIVTVKSSNLISKPYLETKEDVKEFITKLENKLNQAIDNNKRIRID